MNVGLYYHIDVVPDGPEGVVRVPAHFGIFVEELARQAGSVTLYGHPGPDTGIEDHELPQSLVRWRDLGPRGGFLDRTLRPGRALDRFDPLADGVDTLLLRGPSPLLPHLARRAGELPTALLLVGDYATRSTNRAFPRWRNAAIDLWVRLYAWLQRRAARGNLVLVNAQVLAEPLGSAPARVREVFTSSLTEADLSSEQAHPRAVGSPARLLYTGRIVEEKGLFEAVYAVAELRTRGIDAVLDVVGWEPPGGKTRSALEEEAMRLEIADGVRFPGFVPAGAELTAVYRKADLFLMPSRTEGFPHAITEAMAAGLPVIASRVGGIPSRLEDGRNALLVPPRDPVALADAIERLVADDELRGHIAAAGRSWAEAHTNERSCELILGHLGEWMGTARDATRR